MTMRYGPRTFGAMGLGSVWNSSLIVKDRRLFYWMYCYTVVGDGSVYAQRFMDSTVCVLYYAYIRRPHQHGRCQRGQRVMPV